MTSPSSTVSILEALETGISARRATSSRRRAGPQPSARDPYLQAAAVLHVCDLAELAPFGGGTAASDPHALLFADTVPAIGWRHLRLRTLKLDVRRSALRELGSKERMRAALDANPNRQRTSLQNLFERWLTGDTIDLARMSAADLEDLRQLYDWDLEAFGSLPAKTSFETARARRKAVAIFEHLVDRNFVGRTRELQLLRDHVGVVSPSAWAKLRSFIGRETRAPLVIWGPGGSGKTALIGRFLLEHVDSEHGAWFPFAYLAFDSETLDVREPFTLLVAAAAQFAAQANLSDERQGPLASLHGAYRAFSDEVEFYRDQRGALQQRASSFARRGDRVLSESAAGNELYDAFADFLAEIAEAAGLLQKAQNMPVLLVFDTFEEVFYRSRQDLDRFWEMLDYLQSSLPFLRVVIAGRGKPGALAPGRLEPTERELGDLVEADAATLLMKLGVGDIDIATAIYRQIGGNPLTLRLAASVAGAEPTHRRGIEGITTKKLFVFKIAPELVRGQLYRRILDRIHDEDVRNLAHPGMVLRRVTPDIIQRVLAPTCELADVDETRAKDLYSRLQAESALVSSESDGSLRYRDEVRKPMLSLLSQDSPARVKRIHEAAVYYYADVDHSTEQKRPLERAEEIYHRMMLEQHAQTLNTRWLPGVERHLASAVDEVPVVQRRWLASRMSIELSDDVYREADLTDWERLIGQKALEAIRYGGPQEVLMLVHGRSERTPESPLVAIEARALLDLNQAAEAAVVLDRALDRFPSVGNPGRLAELLWLRAQAASALGAAAEAISFLDQLTKATSAMPSRLAHVQALTEIVGHLVQAVQADEHEIGTARQALADALGHLSEADIDSERSLIRLALVRLGRNYPEAIARHAKLVVFDRVFLAQLGTILYRPERAERLANLVRAEPSLAFLSPASTAGSSIDVSRLLDQVVQRLTTSVERTSANASGDQPIQSLVEIVLTVMEMENATLAGASLAGIDDYRESWEMQISRESSV